MYLDGLEDAYEPGRLMGSFAEETAKSYQFTRQAMDEFAIGSLTRAKAASQNRAPSPAGIVPFRSGDPQGLHPHRHRRAARQGRPGQDPDPETGLCQGWGDHRGQLKLDQ